MIGEFITRCLVLVLGYAYPAFQCFKTVEKNRVEIQELRFWCQYWIIVAVLTILEKIGDVFVSWLPMYGEMKLALFIYLWYPKTKGTGYVYETLLRPYVSKHETDIDRSLVEFRNRAWDLAAYYWQNCTELGSIKILQLLQFVASQSTRITQPITSQQNVDNQRPGGAPPPTPPTTPSGILQNNKPEKKRPSVPTWRTSTSNRAQTPKSESIQVQLQDQTNHIRPEDVIVPDIDIGEGSKEKCSVELNLHAARLKLRRSKGGTN
ncbi:putative HVA22-like protein g isoform X1 [Primulina eburnea]|uniref:putative HVA22-like protein g isoform X1 n=1 Tax=Primulina eburnea TaxID=1245227 RepID=UPI003C6C29C6